MRKYCSCLLFLIITELTAALNPVWEARIRSLEQQGLPFFYNEDVQANIDIWLKNEGSATGIIAGRYAAFAPQMELAQKTYGLPWFVKYIPAGNSGLDARFTDDDGSCGIWPLNFSMGKKYGLKQNSYYDERRSVERSSVAACQYLKDLQHIYRDWLKSITAFSIGAVRLNQVIRLSGNNLEFNEIYKYLLPGEKAPIVQFYAALAVLHYLPETGIRSLDYLSPKADTVSSRCMLPMAFVEEKTGITVAALQQLNPEFKDIVIPWFGAPLSFHIPAQQKSAWQKVEDSICFFLTEKNKPVVIYDTIIKVIDSITYIEVKPRPEKPNPIPAPKPVVPKPTPPPVVVPKPNPPAPKPTQKPAPKTPAPTKMWVYYKVKSGDGLYTLSDIFDCSIAELKQWNGMKSNSLMAGSTLKFYVPIAKKTYYNQINAMSLAQKRNLALKD